MRNFTTLESKLIILITKLSYLKLINIFYDRIQQIKLHSRLQTFQQVKPSWINIHPFSEELNG